MIEAAGTASYTFTEWLDSYQQPHTRASYRYAVILFLRTSFKTTGEPERLASRYVKEVRAKRRNYFKDLVSFVNAYGERPPKSLQQDSSLSMWYKSRNFVF